MTQIIAIASGGAIGALLRFWIATGLYRWLGRDFPYGTLGVNVIGSLLMGFLYVYLLERANLAAEWRAFLLVGLLGAFTTFSTFSLETLNLLEAGEPGKAFLNIIASVVLCLLAAWLGILMGREL